MVATNSTKQPFAEGGSGCRNPQGPGRRQPASSQPEPPPAKATLVSNAWINTVFETSGISGGARLIMLALADRANDDGEAWPGIADIAKRAELSERHTKRIIKKLVADGLVEIQRGGGRSRTNRYQLKGDVGVTVCDPETVTSAPETVTSAPPKGDICGAKGDVGVTPTPLTLSRTHKKPSRRFSVAHREQIYQAYPRHVGKAAALRKIDQVLAELAKRSGIDNPVAWLLARVQAFAQSPAGRAGQFTPHPATWFHKGKYDDDDQEWARSDTVEPSNAQLQVEEIEARWLDLSLDEKKRLASSAGFDGSWTVDTPAKMQRALAAGTALEENDQ